MCASSQCKEKEDERERRRQFFPAASKLLVAAKSAYKKAAQALDVAKLAVMMEGAKAFDLCRNLLSNEAR